MKKEEKYATAVKPILEENQFGDGDESSNLEQVQVTEPTKRTLDQLN